MSNGDTFNLSLSFGGGGADVDFKQLVRQLRQGNAIAASQLDQARQQTLLDQLAGIAAGTLGLVPHAEPRTFGGIPGTILPAARPGLTTTAAFPAGASAQTPLLPGSREDPFGFVRPPSLSGAAANAAFVSASRTRTAGALAVTSTRRARARFRQLYRPIPFAAGAF